METLQEIALTGKHVKRSDWKGMFNDVASVGDTVDPKIVEQMAGFVFPRSYCDDYVQPGDESDHDSEGKALYDTFQKLPDGRWVYCGDQHSGTRVKL